MHTDHIGTPFAVSNSKGEIVWDVEFLSYGETRQVYKNKITFNLRLPGQYFDEETGLHYNRHRYYDPELGRYITPDPIGVSGGINLYAYVQNPLSEIDFLGLHGKNKEKGKRQAVGPGQKSPGAFGTKVEITSVDFVRNDLAVIPEWKPTVSGARTVQVERPVRAQISIFGPQEQDGVVYPGGQTQIQILEYNPSNPFVKFIGEETPLE